MGHISNDLDATVRLVIFMVESVCDVAARYAVATVENRGMPCSTAVAHFRMNERVHARRRLTIERHIEIH